MPCTLLASALLLLAAAPDLPALRAQANQAYRAKSYAAAAGLFAQITELTPEDGAAWADLGLGLQKLGKRDEAVAATLKAALLGDAQTRLNAYFNLASLKATLAVPVASFDVEAEPDQAQASCASLPPQGKCTQPLFACSRFEDGSGTGAIFHRASLVFGAERAALEAFAQKTQAIGATPPKASAAIETATYSADLCRSQDLCGFDPCEDETGDAQKRCERKWRAECRKKEAACKSDPVVKLAGCVAVFSDACGGHVGLVCKGAAQELSLPRSQ